MSNCVQDSQILHADHNIIDRSIAIYDAVWSASRLAIDSHASTALYNSIVSTVYRIRQLLRLYQDAPQAEHHEH